MNEQQSYNRQIIDCIKILSNSKDKKASFSLGIVKSVDFANRECSVEVIMGEKNMTLTGIKLSAENNDGLILVPTVESTVILCMMPDNNGYVFMTSDIDKVFCYIDSSNKYEFDTNGFIFNGGLKGGLINIVDLTSSLNTLVTNINTNYTAIAAAIAGLGGAYVATPATTFVKTTYEDTKIKH